MTEIILGLTIFALLGYIGYITHQFRKERAELISRITTRDYKEYVEVRKEEIKKPEKPIVVNPNLIPYEEYSATEEGFEKIIKEQLKGASN